MLERSERAIRLRSRDREFHGLNREFQYAQAQLTGDYLKSKDVKHPRDVGNIREVLLRRFLSDSGYLPRRFAVSQTSFRAASTSGHISNELDIALFDPLDSIRLMGRADVYEVFPIESVHGAIQVKSRLSETGLASALDNIASFKRLSRAESRRYQSVGTSSQHGFGVIFSYETEMAWLDIVASLEAFIAANPPTVWPNAVFIMNVGLFVFGSPTSGHFLNGHIEAIKEPKVHGRPDQGDLLFTMHSMLLEMLRSDSVGPPPFDAYFALPLVAEDQSYRFTLGQFAEVGSCETHGDFARKIPHDSLKALIAWCSTTPSINWIRANDLGMGKPGDNEAAYARQPGDIRIYNPDGLALTDILFRASWINGREVPSLDYDMIEAGGMSIWLPAHYAEARSMITGCPTCAKQKTPGSARA